MVFFSSKVSLEYLEWTITCSIYEEKTSVDLKIKKTAFIIKKVQIFFAILPISSCFSHLRITRQIANA